MAEEEGLYYMARKFSDGMGIVSIVAYEDIDAAKQAALELWQECNGAKGAPYVILKVVAEELIPTPGMNWHGPVGWG